MSKTKNKISESTCVKSDRLLAYKLSNTIPQEVLDNVSGGHSMMQTATQQFIVTETNFGSDQKRIHVWD